MTNQPFKITALIINTLLKLENILDASRKGGFFVPKGTVITGTFTADKSGKIAGTVNGDVFVKGKVTILREAVIRGDIHASAVIVYGKISGDIKCTGKTMLEPGAYIRGDISTVEIHVEKDTTLEGVIKKFSTETNNNTNTTNTNTIVETTLDSVVKLRVPNPPEQVIPETPAPKQTLSDENANSQSWF